MRRPLLLVAAAALAVGGVACSDDGDDATPTTTTSTTEAATTSTTEDDGTTTTDDGDGAGGALTPGTTEDDDGEGAPPADLAARILDVEGFTKDVDGGSDGFGDELCDGSAPSVAPAEAVEADYIADDEATEVFLGLFGMRFASEGDAGTFYDEFTSTTAGCTDEELTVDDGRATGIGGEGRAYRLDFGAVPGAGEAGAGALYISWTDDEVWVLTQFGDDPEVEARAVDVFTAAVG